MYISEFVKKYYLHDSIIETIHYLKEVQKCVINLDLCNYMQAHYSETEPEIVRLQLVVSGVRRISCTPTLIKVDQRVEIQSTILVSEIAPAENQLEAKWEKWKFVLLTDDYQSHTEKVIILIIEASDVISHFPLQFSRF